MNIDDGDDPKVRRKSLKMEMWVNGFLNRPDEGRANPASAKQNGPSRLNRNGPFEFNPGSDLRSHTVTRAVSSALRGLTSVFGMGTGVAPAV
jgi:hypothetical protein